MENSLDRSQNDILMGMMADGRCAMGVIMSYHGWNGRDDSKASSKLLGALVTLRQAGVDKNSLIEMNDSGFSFDEIANYLDRVNELTNLK